VGALVIKLNSALALLLVVCALAIVTSQHKARKLFAELAQEQDAARQVDVEWGQLQLEQSTWAMHARIEKIASSRLQMHVPTSTRIRLVSSDSGYEGVADAASMGRRGRPQNTAARSGAKR
jgi:cell division protein FtsL